jgi:hypothetical protein
VPYGGRKVLQYYATPNAVGHAGRSIPPSLTASDV